MMLIAIDSQNMTRSKRKRENVTKKEGSAVCSNKCQDCKLPELLLWGGTKRPFERNHHFLWQKKDWPLPSFSNKKKCGMVYHQGTSYVLEIFLETKWCKITLSGLYYMISSRQSLVRRVWGRRRKRSSPDLLWKPLTTAEDVFLRHCHLYVFSDTFFVSKCISQFGRKRKRWSCDLLWKPPTTGGRPNRHWPGTSYFNKVCKRHAGRQVKIKQNWG